jgi:uncharacterized protein (TIGR03083 family)
VDVAEHIAVVRREGLLLAQAAGQVALETAIPTCPGWTMRDLVRHIGGIHRWAAMHVREGRTQPVNGFAQAVDAWPSDEALIDWFRTGHARLIDALAEAPPDLQCWSFLPAPSPLAFWARRQAHETAIHRADAQSPTQHITPYPTEVAKDGLDELLLAFVARSDGRLTSDPPRSLHVHATDTDGEWLVRIEPTTAHVSAEHSDADCTLSGAVSDLYLLVWNRGATDSITVAGDASLVDLWRSSVQIRWRGD